MKKLSLKNPCADGMVIQQNTDAAQRLGILPD